MQRYLFIFTTWLLVSLSVAAGASAPLQRVEGVTYLPAPYNDGDSFKVRLQGKPHVIRLYFVDCPESRLSAESDRRRVVEQARYFGLTHPPDIVAFGKAAGGRSAELLQEPFVVHTAFARAAGRSGLPREYAMVELADGRDLAGVLVAEGLARTRGVQRALPRGISGAEYAEVLADAELSAALGRKGIWAQTDPESLVTLREAQREEERQLDALTLGVFSVVSEENPVDINQASSEELQQIKGIGPKTAERIIEARPFRSVDELLKVDGLGKASLNAWRKFLTVGSLPPEK